MSRRKMDMIACFAIGIASATVLADFAIDWSTTDGGGGVSTGGGYELKGTIGQPDASAAGALSGGMYVLTGGFWSVTIPACTTFVAPDLDHDCDVDAADVAAFMACASRAGVPVAPACQSRDFDGDNDADLNDFGILQRCYGNAVPTCVN